jgi:hypothetical protein
MASHDPIAYTYEADTHCPACALGRFGAQPGRPWVRDDAVDREGNGIGAVAPWVEWCEYDPDHPHCVLACGTCGGVIREHDHRQ